MQLTAKIVHQYRELLAIPCCFQGVNDRNGERQME